MSELILNDTFFERDCIEFALKNGNVSITVAEDGTATINIDISIDDAKSLRNWLGGVLQKVVAND